MKAGGYSRVARERHADAILAPRGGSPAGRRCLHQSGNGLPSPGRFSFVARADSISRSLTLLLGFGLAGWCCAATSGPAFVGRLKATLARGDETQSFLYTAGTNTLRIDCLGTNWAHALNLVDRQTGAITLIFPHNRTFVRLPPATNASGREALPGGPPPQGSPPLPGAAPAGLPPSGAMPALPMMPPAPGEKLELLATGDRTNLLGYACARYEIKRMGEVMDIWATDQLLPYQPWLPSQPLRLFGPPQIAEEWGELVKARKLFPLRATLKQAGGPELLQFEVTSINPGEVADPSGALLQPPASYHELQPLPL